MVKTTYNSTEGKNNKLQEVKRKTILRYYKNISNYYEEIKQKKFQTQKDPFSKDAQGIDKTYHEIILLKKFVQTKPQVKNMNIFYEDLYYTVIKTRNEKEVGDNQNENDYINFNDFIPKHIISIKPTETILK